MRNVWMATAALLLTSCGSTNELADWRLPDGFGVVEQSANYSVGHPDNLSETLTFIDGTTIEWSDPEVVTARCQFDRLQTDIDGPVGCPFFYWIDDGGFVERVHGLVENRVPKSDVDPGSTYLQKSEERWYLPANVHERSGNIALTDVGRFVLDANTPALLSSGTGTCSEGIGADISMWQVDLRVGDLLEHAGFGSALFENACDGVI